MSLSDGATLWLGVIGGIQRANNPSLYLWWCLPSGARDGDLLAMYCPASVSQTWHGIFAVYRVLPPPADPTLNSTYCSGFGKSKGHYHYRPLELRQILKERITARYMKAQKEFKGETFIRQNFQGTTFRVGHHATTFLLSQIARIGDQIRE